MLLVRMISYLAHLFDRSNPSGALAFRGGAVEYAHRGRRIWQLPVADVAVVGACTTDSAADDYFLALVRAPLLREDGALTVRVLQYLAARRGEAASPPGEDRSASRPTG